MNGNEYVKLNGNKLLINNLIFDGSVNTQWILEDSFYVDDPLETATNYSAQTPTGTIVLNNGSLNKYIFVSANKDNIIKSASKP